MSVTLTNQIVATGTPVYCSACHGQYPDRQHVDFDAACDRGYGGDGAIKVSMDELVLCEECIREGARLVGMVDAENANRIAELERKVRYERDRADKAEQYADRLEDTIGTRPAPLATPKRRGRPPKQREEDE